MINFIIPALSLGFLGSFHCIGMCGPIALSLPLPATKKFGQFSHLLLYNIGRTITYVFLGLIFGLIGQTFNFLGLQQFLSIGLGSIILLYFIFSSRFSASHKLTAGIYKKMNLLKTTLTKLLFKQGALSVFSVGLLNGLLPCGLVYIAIAGALATSTYAQGAAFMGLFGLATIPMMLSISLFGTIVSIKFKNNIRKLTPFIVSVMAVLLILRGLNLNIPYISPIHNAEINSAKHVNEIKCYK